MENKPKSRMGLVGGQAVLEGVMMKSGDDISLSVRQENGAILNTHETYVSVRKKHPFLNLPLLRGCVNFVEMMKISMDTLNRSMEMLGIDDEEPENRLERWIDEKLGDKMLKIVSGIGMVLGLALGVGLFLLLPTFVTKWLHTLTGGHIAPFRALIEGVIRIGVFLAYVALVGLIPDMRRTYEYHGAEHKSVACFEAGLPLTPENAKTCTRFHPRCGTSFIFVMLILSIIVSSFLTWDNVWLRFASKLLTIPLIVGLGFEYIMYAGRHNNLFTRILSAPGLWVQRITTREPDEAQLSVAITAILGAIPADFRAEVQAELASAGVSAEPVETWTPKDREAAKRADADGAADAGDNREERR